MSLPSMTVPALVTFWLPFSTWSFTPPGTPVFDASGNPHELGCGPQSARLRSAGVLPLPLRAGAGDFEAEADGDGEGETDALADGGIDGMVEEPAGFDAGTAVWSALIPAASSWWRGAMAISTRPAITTAASSVISTVFRLSRRFVPVPGPSGAPATRVSWVGGR